ncbi:MarR family winged helix-turn-helix transcriptional regulator [Roseateles depolymerans]|uniref:Transcriptional regulator, MarR family n=1 Tax=Roseateles depolymerans TaxID=76731 RepID=A0A0U3N1I9_9BURK|nr:MarR family transcriptional regulator [Roseateles depolymerans]ALV06091.1 Transcriptional regulator, MarR family [Roseateles depolymerans]REG11933.1 DNA-binding MarR family transcriptional regulator [Roseateles depolymerans]
MSTNTTDGRGMGRGASAADRSRRSDDDVLELIHTVMHQYRARQYRVLKDGPHDITHMDGKVLGFFHRHPGATQSDLAQHSGRDKAQLARLIKGLRERGLLTAEADEQDRRQVRLQLSEQGRAVQQALRRASRHLSVNAVQGMSAEEQQQLLALLGKVKANLDREE